MPTASLSLADTTYDSISNNPFRIVVSELLSAFTTSSVIISGRTAYLNYSYQTGNDYIFTFGNATPVGEAGYVRIQIPATAATPNLDEDYDWTIYWGTDNVLHFGDTDAVRSSRITTTLNNVRWGSSNVSAGTVTPIYFEFSIDTFNFANSDITLNGDITTIGSLSRTTLQRYLGHITLPADLGDSGSFTVQIADLESTYPGLNVSEEWTLSWNSSGRTSAIRTNDIPAVARIELSSDYVLAGGEIFATFHFDKDIQALIVSSLVFEDATFLRTSGSPNDREWSIAVGAPSTGNGIGRIILPENVVQPSGNNAVTAEFTYINAVDVDIELSTASAQNGETVLATFNFNYDIPEFNADWLSLNIGSEILGLNNEILALNEEVLGYPIAPSDVAGEPTSLDEQNRAWQIPIELPQSGEGMYQIALEEDAIGIRHSAAMAEVQFAPIINNNIAINSGQVYVAFINQNFRANIKITGNNIRSVDVEGLLRPFSHQWDSTRGMLSILGRPEKYYKNLKFEIIARDNNGVSKATGTINVEDITPAIVKPKNPLLFVEGIENSHTVVVDNKPSSAEVKGTWMGLDHEVSDEGVIIKGETPEKNIGVRNGVFKVKASNSKGDAPETDIPWKFADPQSAYLFETQAVAYVTKYNTNGAEVFRKSVSGASSNDSVFAVDSQDNLYFGKGRSGWAKYDSQGGQIWKARGGVSNELGGDQQIFEFDHEDNIFLFNSIPGRNGIIKRDKDNGNILWDEVAQRSGQFLLQSLNKEGDVICTQTRYSRPGRGLVGPRPIHKISGGNGSILNDFYPVDNGNWSLEFLAVGPDDDIYYKGYLNTTHTFGKLTSSGSSVWQKTHDTGDSSDTEFDYIAHIRPSSVLEFDDDGNIHLFSVQHSATENLIYKLDSNGNLIWEYSHPIAIRGHPVLYKIDGNIFFLERNGNNHKLNKLSSSGYLVWTQDLTPSSSASFRYRGVRVGNDAGVYLINQSNARFYKYSGLGNENAVLQWEKQQPRTTSYFRVIVK